MWDVRSRCRWYIWPVFCCTLWTQSVLYLRTKWVWSAAGLCAAACSYQLTHTWWLKHVTCYMHFVILPWLQLVQRLGKLVNLTMILENTRFPFPSREMFFCAAVSLSHFYCTCVFWTSEKSYLQILATALSEADVSQQILYWHSDTDSEVDLIVTINGTFGTWRKTWRLSMKHTILGSLFLFHSSFECIIITQTAAVKWLVTVRCGRAPPTVMTISAVILTGVWNTLNVSVSSTQYTFRFKWRVTSALQMSKK